MKLMVVGLVVGIVLGGTATGYAVSKSRPIVVPPETGVVFRASISGATTPVLTPTRSR